MIEPHHFVELNLGFLSFLVPDDFDDFCYRASKLAGDSYGAPLFTVAETHSSNSVRHGNALNDGSRLVVDNADVHVPDEGGAQEDDWQIL